jgi:hypothetical protein
MLGILMIILVGCRQAEPLASTDINIDVNFASEALAVGEDTILVTITDKDGNAINDATVNIRGDMSHAGMIPVLVDIEAGADGVYSAPYDWSMAGDWEVGVTVTLPDGTTAAQTFDYTVAGDMSGMDMGDMESADEADMDGMNMDNMEATEESGE